LLLDDEVGGGESNPALRAVDDERVQVAEVVLAVDVGHVVEGSKVVSLQLDSGTRRYYDDVTVAFPDVNGTSFLHFRLLEH